MAAEPQLFATAQSFLGIAPEPTRNTAGTVFIWAPYKTPQLTPNQTYLVDEGLRGSPVTTYDVVMGVRNDTMEFKGDVHLDTFPALTESMLGVDTLTGTGPYIHTQKLLNSAAVGSQPKSYTIQDFNGFICQQITGAQIQSLEIDFATTDSLNFSAKYVGSIATTVAMPTTETFSAVDRLVPSWSCAFSIAGTPNATLVSGSIVLDRGTEAVAVIGQQGPGAMFSGPLKVTGKLTFLTVTSDPIFAAGLTSQLQALAFTFTDPSSTHTLLVTMSKVQFENPKYDRSKNYVQVTVDFEATSNTTDAVSGYSPISFVTTNAVATAF